MAFSPRTDPSSEPQLAPPGAGIPRIERVIGGAIFALRRRFGSRERFTAEFTRERAAIARLYGPLDDTACALRVLIPRLRGLEDSSRFWSVWMTLEHLRIVNGEIARVIAALSHDIRPEGAVSTAAVKPGAEVGPEVIEGYERSCDALATTVRDCAELRSRLRHAHPWFGPLDAAGWHAMAAMHMSIHRRQIERIIEGLASAREWDLRRSPA